MLLAESTNEFIDPILHFDVRVTSKHGKESIAPTNDSRRAGD